MKGRAGFTEVLPGRLYQRGQFLTWPARQKRKLLDNLGITVVVNLWHKIDADLSPDDHGRIYINWHVSPSDAATVKNAWPLVELLAKLMHRGERVLVHCEAGRGRSVWLCAELVKAVTGMSGLEALSHVRERIPAENMRPELIQHLLEESPRPIGASH